ncbi:hypothetical protein [Streptantibioticus silvisoli]|uniref:WXG100 family type VII secretion target n=1 Tax=Streptantibioticus silvisoli TaxID=2705255 RepID=A0ABT6W8F3_9ACTN|nr:hypothetical protein [Streptantibioticus silvisoli]MDI5967025.1 hypothetical protein [Streptantibioticus silvisoli]
MLAEALTGLAAAGGGAVVQAAGTDAWNGLRHRVREIFGRGDALRAQGAVDRLEDTSRVLAAGVSGDVAGQRERQEGVWAGRFEALLEGLDDAGRESAVAGLRDLVSFVAASCGQTAFATGRAVARDGGSATTGIRTTGGRQGSARVAHTGDAEATGAGSSAVSGIVND